jgi:hypothetical protein
MVRHHDAVEAVVDRELRILGGHQAFHEKARFHRVAQALDELPGEHGVAGGVEAGKVDAVKIGFALHEALHRALVAGRAVTLVERYQAVKRLPVLPGQHIDRDDNGPGSRLLGAAGQSLRHFPLVGGIELEPDRPAACGNRIFDRGRGNGRQHREMIAGPGRPRDAELAVTVEGLIRAGRSDDDRAAIGLAEQLHPGVDLAHIDQAARPELELLKTLAVGAQRHFVVDT